MELSVLIAKILAVIYVSAALGAMFSANYYRRLIDDLFNNAGLTYVSGFLALMVGFLIVTYHNLWGRDWTVLITIVGWLALTKGVLLIAFPEFVRSYSRPVFAGRGLKVFPYIAMALALLFGYFGFVVGAPS